MENLVDFIYCCGEHPNAKNELFLISDGNDISTTEIINKLALAMNKKTIIFSFPFFLKTLIKYLNIKLFSLEKIYSSLQIDISKSYRLLRWKPSETITNGLTKMIFETGNK